MPGSNQRTRKFETEEELKEFQRQKAAKMREEIIVDPETGLERRKFGGPQPGSGRPPKRRPIESLQTKFVDDDAANAAITQVFMDAIDEDKPISIRLRAANSLLTHLRNEERDKAEERRGLQQHERDAILGGILRRLGVADGGATGDVVDGEVLAVDDGGTGRGTDGVPELGMGSGAA
jgi:hypothetical protein